MATWCASVITATRDDGTQYNTLEITPMVSSGRPPVSIDPATCQAVLESGSEYNGWSQLFALSIDDAQTIGVHIMLVWAIAWTYRALARVLLSPSNERYDHE